jgi:hypothetical protein
MTLAADLSQLADDAADIRSTVIALALNSAQNAQLSALALLLGSLAGELRGLALSLPPGGDALPPPAPEPPPPAPPPGPFFPPDAVLGNSLEPVAAAGSFKLHNVSATTFDHSQALKWDNLNGDWLDRAGIQQGPTPWYSVTIPKLTVGEVRFDVTELAQRQSAVNRGLYIRVAPNVTTSAWVRIAGSDSGAAPLLLCELEDGTVRELRGRLVGATVAKSTASSVPGMLDIGLSVKLTKSVFLCLQFPELDGLDIVSAELGMLVMESDDVYALTMQVFELDPPPLLLGGAGMTPFAGLAVEVGSEEALTGHPDVFAAGDFRESSWNNEPGVWRDTLMAGNGNPAGLFHLVTMDRKQYEKAECVPDPGHPGRFALKTCIATGNVGGGSLQAFLPVSADLTDPTRPMLLQNVVEEVFVRVEVYLDQDSFNSTLYGFKFSPVGIDQRMGLYGDTGWGAGGSTYVFGSGQTASNGRKRFDPAKGQWVYEGHSLRGHTLGQPHPTTGPYRESIAAGFAPSHLGPYDTLWDGGLYGTEQNMRMFVLGDPSATHGAKRKRQHSIPKGRWVTMESKLKLNTLNISATPLDANGNYPPNSDGELKLWMDGVLVGSRTNLAFRCHPECTIRGNWMMAHHGGNDATDHDIVFWLRNFAMARRYIGPSARLYANR